MVLKGRFNTQHGCRNAISVNIGHILQLQHPLVNLSQLAGTQADQRSRQKTQYPVSLPPTPLLSCCFHGQDLNVMLGECQKGRHSLKCAVSQNLLIF